MAYDGSGRASIANSEMEFDVQPAWSPDGTKIAFSRGTQRYAGSSDIYVASADGLAVTKLTNLAGNEVHPTWSPDGSRITFLNDYGLWVMNADGSDATMIFGSPDLRVAAPSWSPVDSRIVFHGYFYDPDTGWTTSDIFTLNDDGSQLTRLTSHPAGEALPAWSPDGTRIAFARMGTSSVDWDIHVISADGSNEIKLADNGTDPAWSPDGETIAFTRMTATDQDIYSIALDGAIEVNLTNSPAHESSPAWQPVPPTATAAQTSTKTRVSTEPIALISSRVLNRAATRASGRPGSAGPAV
jgi:Tol biopolymer transport system component